MIDFEKAAINTFQRVFDTATSRIADSGRFVTLQTYILSQVHVRKSITQSLVKHKPLLGPTIEN